MPLVEKSIGVLFVVEKDRSSMHHVTQVENTLGSGRILIHNCHATMNGPAFGNTREHGTSEGFPFQIHVVFERNQNKRPRFEMQKPMSDSE